MRYVIRTLFILQILAVILAFSPMFTEQPTREPYRGQQDVPVEVVENDSTEEWKEKIDTIYTNEDNITIIEISRIK